MTMIDIINNDEVIMRVFEKISQELDDTTMDNERFAYLDDPEMVAKYLEAFKNGCCGFYDDIEVVNGRLAVFGCNYGH